jgi:16S rRNA (guanine966-N2)-methyltransferase
MARRPRTSAPPAEASEPPRIIGGDLRGRRLAHRPGGPTRPMKDRVRETLFDLLGTRVKGAVAVDLFAGTGALGFEAVSRGATRAVFVERHFPTADVLRRSAEGLGVAERCQILPGDALVWPRRMPDLPRDGRWLVFISPPWQLFVDRGIVVEADERFDPAGLPEAASWETRAIPPAVLHFHGRLVS